jgi:hypothetical protein
LLKNSAELPKSTQLKELFDIVATNLSVFSREVVSQKETLTDITLRLDAIRSDDSHKKDIIKNKEAYGMEQMIEQMTEYVMAAIYTIGNGIANNIIIPIHGLIQLISQIM